MKKLKQLIFISMFYAVPILHSIEKLKPHPRIKPEMTLMVVCLVVKEFIYCHLVMPFWIDFNKLEQCNMYCDQCNFKINIMESYGYFAAAGQVDIVNIFKKLLYIESIQNICDYLVKVNIAEERECTICHDYCGWHSALVQA